MGKEKKRLLRGSRFLLDFDYYSDRILKINTSLLVMSQLFFYISSNAFVISFFEKQFDCTFTTDH